LGLDSFLVFSKSIVLPKSHSGLSRFRFAFIIFAKKYKMSLEKLINEDIKASMIAKDKKKLAALRAIKAGLLLEKTGKDIASAEVPESVEMKLLQKLVKQRKEAAELYHQQNRLDLAEEEEFQANIIQAYLPKQMNEESLRAEIRKVIEESGAAGMKDMGKVMGLSTKKFAGRANNKLISQIVKRTTWQIVFVFKDCS
jgi:uncharacterized protein YqeY